MENRPTTTDPILRKETNSISITKRGNATTYRVRAYPLTLQEAKAHHTINDIDSYVNPHHKQDKHRTEVQYLTDKTMIASKSKEKASR